MNNIWALQIDSVYAHIYNSQVSSKCPSKTLNIHNFVTGPIFIVDLL